MGAPTRSPTAAPRRIEALAYIIERIQRSGTSPSYGEIGRALHPQVDKSRARQLVDQLVALSHAGLFMLLRVGITDERWLRGMAAIRDSIRIIGSRTYVRFYDRPTPDATWRGISMDLASA